MSSLRSATKRRSCPLIEKLSFIRSKTHWGAAFRFGYIKVPEADFALIADAMNPRVGAR